MLITVSVLYSGVVRHNKNESAASDAAPVYDTEEAAEAPAADYYEEEAAEAPVSDRYEEEPAAASESTFEGEAAESFMPAAENRDEQDKTAGATGGLMYGKAAYDNGILTIEVTGTLPTDIKDMSYSITGKDDAGSEKTYSAGILGDILKESVPFTLDISGLKLPDGTYTLSIAEQNIEFAVK